MGGHSGWPAGEILVNNSSSMGGPDVAGAVECWRAATDALRVVRERGYDGSIRLLRDMAAAGYDVDKVVE